MCYISLYWRSRWAGSSQSLQMRQPMFCAINNCLLWFVGSMMSARYMKTPLALYTCWRQMQLQYLGYWMMFFCDASCRCHRGKNRHIMEQQTCLVTYVEWLLHSKQKSRPFFMFTAWLTATCLPPWCFMSVQLCSWFSWACVWHCEASQVFS